MQKFIVVCDYYKNDFNNNKLFFNNVKFAASVSIYQI